MDATCVSPAPLAQSGRGPLERLVRDAAVIHVSGKGGAGKTTVAAALGMAAARLGRRTVVCDLAGTGRLAAAFGVPAGGGDMAPLSPRLWTLGLDPEHALREWLRRQPGGPVAAALLARSPMFAQFVAAAPGAKELVTVGKLLDLAGLAPTSPERVPYDLVVVDAPSTGHAVGMLAAPGTVAAAVPGTVGEQAAALHDVLCDPSVTAYVGVSLPEEMSRREVLELDRGLRETLTRGLDVIVVNGVWPDRFSDDEADRLQALADVHPWVGAALTVHRRARRHVAQVRALRAEAPCPVVTLPYRFAPALAAGDCQAFARALMSVGASLA